MSILANRLDKVIPALSGKERAILALRALKERRSRDPAWRTGMSNPEMLIYNRLISLMNVASNQLVLLITFIEGEVEKLELRLALWCALHFWELNLAEIDYAASVVARESITESDYRKLAAKAENEYVAVAVLASALAEYERGWADDDLEQLGHLPELVVKPDAWRRLCKEAEVRLREAVKKGELDSKGDGRGLRIRHGSFDLWCGRPLTLSPEWAGGYDVLADGRAEQAAADRSTLNALREAIDRTPLERRADAAGADMPGGLHGLIGTLESRIRSVAIQRWNDIRVAEVVLGEIGADFDGEDPLKPDTRAALDEAKRSLRSIVGQIEVYVGPIELPEPTAAELQELRNHVEMWVA